MSPLPPGHDIDVRLWALDGVTITTSAATTIVTGTKRRGTIAALTAARGQIVTPADLASRLWTTEELPATWQAKIHTHISNARHDLGPCRDRLVTVGGGYRLMLAPHESDLGRFYTAVRAADAAVHNGRIGEAMVAFQSAVSIWREPASLPDAMADMVTAWRHRYAAVVARYGAVAESANRADRTEPYTTTLAI